MKTLSTFLLTIIAFILIILACTKWDLERIGFTQVITVGVIEVGASSAFLIGDIEGLRGGDVTETGFVYSSTATNKSTLQLGNNNVGSKTSLRSDTTSDRAFAARIDGLEPNTSYSFRAFIKLSGIQEAIYGEIDSFNTGGTSLSVFSISPSNSGCPTTVTFEIQVEQSGSNSETTFGLIWSDSEENDSPTIQNGSFVTGTPDAHGIVKLELEMECDKVYFIRGGALLPGGIPILSDVKTLTAEPIGKWVRRSDFPGDSRIKPYSFSQGNSGYIGEGYKTLDSFYLNHWIYDFKQDIWLEGITQRGEFLIVDGIQLPAGGAGFVTIDIGGEIYRFTHQIHSLACKQYSASLGDSACEPCSFCECSLAGSGGYTVKWAGDQFNLLGLNFGLNGNIPGPYTGLRTRAVGISIFDKGYIGAGRFFVGCQDGGINEPFKDFWEFTPPSGPTPPDWKQMDDIPGDFRDYAVGFNIENLGFVGLGFNNSNDPVSDFYRFDPSLPSGSQWTPQSDFPNNYQNKGPGFTLKDKGYVIATEDRNSTIELWQFDPNDNPMGVWNRMADLPASPGGLIQAHFVIDNIAYVYLDSIPDNFWMYVPSL